MMGLIVIGFVILFYALDLGITLVNYRHRDQPVPENARDIYDQEQYAQWLNYSMETMRYEVIIKTVSTFMLLVLLVLGFFGWLESLTNQWFRQPILQTIAFLGVFFMFTTLLGLPFNYYATFVLEEKYGFNKSTHKTFFLDAIKSFLLIALLGGGVVTLLQILFQTLSSRLALFILSAWVLLSVVIVLIFVLNTKVFVKIFNKLSPLPDGQFKEEIEALASKVGFNVNAIWVMDASKRSTKLNAFFSGLGKTREVVLFDTLIEKMGEEEMLTVLAHELGHAIHKDVPRLLGLQIAVLGMYAALIGFILQNAALAQSFGLPGVHFGFSMVMFGILVEPVMFFLSIPLNFISRKAEYAADAFAARLVGKAPAMNAFKILARENLANLNPHPLYV